ncbi:MAG: TetR/AcrR family transcriptional regulator [Thermincola sp.]|jgi:AcrR family transcriptional regulator|nr:TetR/AcrR family transcriptional regulator [Thermincola sp.]MDT3702260.1 TetR/AcrR family transcriptional regulator [Thermincola sp.]
MVKEERLSKEERIRHVVQTAKTLFIRHGYAATSTAQIAREAGIAEMTLFRYFATKRELFGAVIAPLIEINWFQATPANEQSPTRNSILTSFHERFRFVRQEKELVRLVIIESQLQPELAGEFNPVARVSSQLHKLLTGLRLSETTAQVIINLIMGLFLTVVFAPGFTDSASEATFKLMETQISELLAKEDEHD